MKKKRFVKLLMSIGYSRNRANFVAGLIPLAEVTIFGQTERLTFARSWNAVLCHHRVKEMAERQVTAAEA